MTSVYGNQNTCELKEVTVTHSLEHGTRYNVDQKTACFLEYELEAADRLISEWVLKYRNFVWPESSWCEWSWQLEFVRN